MNEPAPGSAMLSLKRPAPDDLPAFAGLDVRRVTIGRLDEQVAVHVAGTLGGGRLPLLCVAGLTRNMADFAEFATLFQRGFEPGWPVVLVDLKGRGRASDRFDRREYLSTIDARDLLEVLAALAIDSAVLVGQGYGGQVAMALAAAYPRTVSGAVLIDAGPVSDPRGLVRLRSNLTELDGARGQAGYRSMFRRLLAADYPGVPETDHDRLAGRTHFLDKRQRVHALFDRALVDLLKPFEHDDILVPSWAYFDALAHAPLLLLRTQLTEQLRRETFEEMLRRRPDAEGFLIEGQGSPALLATPEDVGPIVDFMRKVTKRKPKG
jgi:pimeloyl-ACP methyl ester carboxylesterase